VGMSTEREEVHVSEYTILCCSWTVLYVYGFGATGLTVAQPVPNTVCRFKFLGAGLQFKCFSFKKIESKVRFHVPKHQGYGYGMWRETLHILNVIRSK
jgi:hypothetical protein